MPICNKRRLNQIHKVPFRFKMAQRPPYKVRCRATLPLWQATRLQASHGALQPMQNAAPSAASMAPQNSQATNPQPSGANQNSPQFQQQPAAVNQQQTRGLNTAPTTVPQNMIPPFTTTGAPVPSQVHQQQHMHPPVHLQSRALPAWTATFVLSSQCVT